MNPAMSIKNLLFVSKRFAKFGLIKPIIMYQSVSYNIYKTGNTYRVRYTKSGKRFSKCFTTKKAAIEFRNKVMA